MNDLSEKAKRRMELKGIYKNLRTIYYELSNYPNWMMNPNNSSGNNISNIKNWCIGIDDVEIRRVKNEWRYPDLQMDMDLIVAKIINIPFGIAGFEYNNAGFEAIRIIFYIRNKIMINVVMDESYSQRRGDFGEIRKVEEYHESDELEAVLRELSTEVDKKWKKFWEIKNSNNGNFTFN